MTGYNVTIRECSKDLSAKEKIALKDYSNATQLDAELDNVDSIVITPSYYALLDVHNEHSKQDKDYEKILIVDVSGNKFVTGSQSFCNAFKEIYNLMAQEAPGEEYSIEVYKKPSKNYSGKSFISCSIVL